MKPKLLDLFAGIGGFSLAGDWAGFETVAFCEQNEFCQKVLTKHWPGVPIFDDVRTLDADTLRRRGIGEVDLITGGFPCQPFSDAGKKRGRQDDRFLWPEMLRLIKELQPSWVVGENVTGFVRMALGECLADMEAAGYEVRPFIIPACGIGSPQRRDRVWIVAYSDSHRGRKWIPAKREGCETMATDDSRSRGRKKGSLSKESASAVSITGWDRFTRRSTSEPCVARVVDGIPGTLDRLRSLGNAIVPQVAYPILAAIYEQLQAE